MWFKQAHIFQFENSFSYAIEKLEEKLQPLAFRSCLASLPSSHGWVSPIDQEGAPLVHAANGYLLICMQLEEKVLPAAVIRQELNEKIKQIETAQDRKVYQKEKRSLKDEISFSLLPRAFSKLSKIYAYIDTENNRLVVDTIMASKIKKFIELFKKSVNGVNCKVIETKKIAPILTRWLLEDGSPRGFSIEKSCLLKDPNQQNRVVRCQHQDLSFKAIQSLLKDGCQVNELSISWQDRINFTLTNEFVLKSIRYQDEVLNIAKEQYSESQAQRFNTDFIIMSRMLNELIEELLSLFVKGETNKTNSPVIEEIIV